VFNDWLLGGVKNTRNTFIDFQKYLYAGVASQCFEKPEYVWNKYNRAIMV